MYEILLWLSVVVTGLASAGTADQVLMELQAAPCYSGSGDPGMSMDDCVYMEEQQQGKRTAAVLPLPCSCDVEDRLLDLGHQYWPRFLPSVECPGTVCWRGPYRCRPIHYSVKVLKRRDEIDILSRQRDISLPEPLQDLWKFDLIKVVVSCQCSSVL